MGLRFHVFDAVFAFISRLLSLWVPGFMYLIIFGCHVYLAVWGSGFMYLMACLLLF